MLNFEKWKNELIKGKAAVDKCTDELNFCNNITCRKCKFQNKNCNKELMKWCFSEVKRGEEIKNAIFKTITEHGYVFNQWLKNYNISEVDWAIFMQAGKDALNKIGGC